MITLSAHKKFKRTLFFCLILSFIFVIGYLGTNPRAQEPTSTARRGFVSDFAGVVDDKTKQRLEMILENIRLKSGIELDLATVQTTGKKDIFEFSRQLANDWNVGAYHTRKKTLLLVVSVNERAVFTQFSRSVQGELPEGILGEISQRVRLRLSSDEFSQGLSDGVDHFVAIIGKKLGFSLQDIDPSSISAVEPAQADPTPTTPAESPAPAPAEKANTETSAVVMPTPQPSLTRELNTSATRARRITPTKPIITAEDEDEAEEVELTLTLPLAERAAKLKEFLAAHPNSQARQRAGELLISSYAGLGDESLKNGDSKGVEQLMLIVKEAPADMSDKLFSGVISQVPLNLYVRGYREAALEAAKIIESRFGADPRRLVPLAEFFLGIEYGEEAERVASQAVKLAPESAEANFALARSLHISLRLDEAAAAYKRALELDPNVKKGARRSLADLNRALGKTEEALSLYREQLAVDPADKAARAGLVVSLFELGRSDEANQALDKALQESSRNLPLLTGVAYWFAAHKEFERAVETARKAVDLEPRYTWSQIALARALVGQKKPLEAEGPIRFARQYGKFPTLDYELATVLAAAGLYEEAAEVLLQSFTVKDGQIETRLAGRLVSRESDFIRLLAPERRASVFQFAAADDGYNAAMLKALLTFTLATAAPEGGRPDEVAAATAAKEFAAGADEMRAYRQLYAANRLLKNRLALQTAYELAEAARSNVDAALEVSSATVAVQAEELRPIRAKALAQGVPPNIPIAATNILGNLLRGRAEDVAGWALYNQDKNAEAIAHLKRAVSILPEGTPAWRDSLWHLGAAHDQAGNKEDALSYYIRSYNAGDPDPGRRTVIEQLYQKTNGSLDGLNERIGTKALAASDSASSVASSVPVETPSPASAQAVASPELTLSPSPTASPVVAETEPAATPEASPTPDASPSPEASIPSSGAPVRPSRSSATENFPGTLMRTTLKISGKIKDATNAPIQNVVVVLISPRGTVIATTTDSDGNYSFVVAPSQLSYRLIPSKDGYTFTPVDKVLTGLTDDQKGVDFVVERSRAP